MLTMNDNQHIIFYICVYRNTKRRRKRKRRCFPGMENFEEES